VPVNIPRQALTLPLIRRVPTKLLGYLNINRYSHLYRPFLYIPLHRLKSQKCLPVTLACTLSGKDNLFPGLISRTPAPNLPAILGPSIYQISTSDQRVISQVDNQCSCDRVLTLRRVQKQLLVSFCPNSSEKQSLTAIVRKGSVHDLCLNPYQTTILYLWAGPREQLVGAILTDPVILTEASLCMWPNSALPIARPTLGHHKIAIYISIDLTTPV
jgi:hypothetical protein